MTNPFDNEDATYVVLVNSEGQHSLWRRSPILAVRATTESGEAGLLPLTSAPAFVGRGREVAALAEALARPPAVILVEGEAGIGKSRLLQELLAAPATGQAGA